MRDTRQTIYRFLQVCHLTVDLFFTTKELN